MVTKKSNVIPIGQLPIIHWIVTFAMGMILVIHPRGVWILHISLLPIHKGTMDKGGDNLSFHYSFAYHSGSHLNVFSRKLLYFVSLSPFFQEYIMPYKVNSPISETPYMPSHVSLSPWIELIWSRVTLNSCVCPRGVWHPYKLSSIAPC